VRRQHQRTFAYVGNAPFVDADNQAAQASPKWSEIS
jgi:hypothetical protein